jgi:hypothetical protein
MTVPANSRPGNAPINSPIYQGAPSTLMQAWMSWFTRISALFSPATDVTTITVTGSIFTYTNTTQSLQQVLIVGGTVTAISFGRNGMVYTLGPTATNIILSSQDFVQVSYTTAPAMYASPL